MKKIIIFIAIVVCATTLSTTRIQGAKLNPKPKENTSTHVLIVGGVNKEPQERQSKDKAVMKL